MTTTTHFTESGSSPPRKRPDLSLYFPALAPRRTKPLGTKFKIHQSPKTKDDLRRVRARLRAKPRRRV